MARCIDADKLLEYLEKAAESEDVKYSFIGAGVQATINEIKKFHREDVAPVVHAHWEMYRDETNCTYGNYACTNCHTIQGLMKYRYCPYCGAKMDEEMSK